TEVKPAQGFAAESSTAATILASSALGFALSTTQVASGSVIGSGLGRRGSVVRWRTAGRIAIGWLLTLPAAGGVGAFAALFVMWFDGWGVLIDAVIAVVVIVGLFLRSRKNAVNSANAMSDVAESGHVVDLPEVPGPTRRTSRIELMRALERAERKADEAERAARRAKKLKKAGGTPAEIKAARKAADRAAQKYAEAERASQEWEALSASRRARAQLAEWDLAIDDQEGAR